MAGDRQSIKQQEQRQKSEARQLLHRFRKFFLVYTLSNIFQPSYLLFDEFGGEWDQE